MKLEKSRIREGDIVAVNFNNAQATLCHRARVEYTPCATGDSWVFTDMDTGDIHYVSEGCTISKIADQPNASAHPRRNQATQQQTDENGVG